MCKKAGADLVRTITSFIQESFLSVFLFLLMKRDCVMKLHNLV